MKSAEDGNLIVAKLDDGEILFESLKGIIEKHRIESGLVISGIGMLQNLTLGYFDGKVYQRRDIKKPCELISLHGSISTRGGIVIHLHAALADESNHVIGGHLFNGEVYSLNEIVVRRLQRIIMRRESDPMTKLRVLDFD